MRTHSSYGASERTSRVLRISLAVTLAYIVLLVIAGFRAHSLALVWQLAAPLLVLREPQRVVPVTHYRLVLLRDPRCVPRTH